MTKIPTTQYAVQLVGADELSLNTSKEIVAPDKYQIVCRVESVGLCFSDLKLLKQFSSHVRKGDITCGIDSAILKEISSYVPGELPTVPGHEAVVRVVAVGKSVENFEVGQRCLVQTDYRWLKTVGSNASFGYNFEGGLQEYVLMDTRVITSPEGKSMLIPVPEELSASAIALIEPWACVENAYTSSERRSLKTDGKMLVVADVEVDGDVLNNLFNSYGEVEQITWVSKLPVLSGLNVAVEKSDASELDDTVYDDVVYFGSDPKTVEMLFEKIGPNGLFNIVLCGGKFDADVVTPVGRVHYGNIRIIGTLGCDPADSMKGIPETGEIRANDKVNIIGAGGPMGMMHVIRSLCEGIENISVFAGDLDKVRLAALTKVAGPLAEKNNVPYKTYDPAKEKMTELFEYTALMVPVPGLVASAVPSSSKGGIINIFAGIPATVSAKLDLDTYIEKQLYFIGTSGSVLDDMERVLAKVKSGKLDTNVSVAAVCGLESSIQGIRSVENRQIAGKIVVYPSCRGLGLVLLEELGEKMPEVAECLNDGLWTGQAEQKLLEKY